MIPEGYRIRELESRRRPGAGSGVRAQPRAPRTVGAGPDPSWFTADGQSAAIAGQLTAAAQGLVVPWVLVREGQVVGRVNLNNLVMGVLRSASIGYWVDAAHLGRGLASGAVEFACEQARGRGLHRVEAGTLVHNTASQRVLEGCRLRVLRHRAEVPVHRRRLAGPPAVPADPARRPAVAIAARSRRNRSVRRCGCP